MVEKTEVATAPPPDQETLQRTWTRWQSFVQSLPEDELLALPYVQRMARSRGEDVEGYFFGIDCYSVYELCSVRAGADPYWDAPYTIKDYAFYEFCVHAYGCFGW